MLVFILRNREQSILASLPISILAIMPMGMTETSWLVKVVGDGSNFRPSSDCSAKVQADNGETEIVLRGALL
jgi:hypothetical protein